MQDDIDSPIYQKATLYHIKSSGDKIEQYLENKSFKFIWEDPKFLESILTPKKALVDKRACSQWTEIGTTQFSSVSPSLLWGSATNSFSLDVTFFPFCFMK